MAAAEGVTHVVMESRGALEADFQPLGELFRGATGERGILSRCRGAGATLGAASGCAQLLPGGAKGSFIPPRCTMRVGLPFDQPLHHGPAGDTHHNPHKLARSVQRHLLGFPSWKSSRREANRPSSRDLSLESIRQQTAPNCGPAAECETSSSEGRESLTSRLSSSDHHRGRNGTDRIDRRSPANSVARTHYRPRKPDLGNYRDCDESMVSIPSCAR